jgi:5,10-methenyltetrahydrofolate synthetase
MSVRDTQNPTARYVSPVCYAADVENGVDEQQQRDLTQWRKAERQRQREIRRALTPEQRQTYAQAIAECLDVLLAKKYVDLRGKVLGGYWPIQGEFDLVFWFHALHERGVRIALPVTDKPDAPLIFRAWTPNTVMKKDCWHIPIPPAESAQLTPDILLAPCVAWDTAGFRLGYGGGYFDRTLAALSPKPFVIGVALQAAQLPTIFPQAYDVAMDAIVTEAGAHPLSR